MGPLEVTLAERRELIEHTHPKLSVVQQCILLGLCRSGTDITYIPIKGGYMYLCAIIDWHSRYVLAWGISNTHDSEFCQELLKEAISKFSHSAYDTRICLS